MKKIKIIIKKNSALYNLYRKFEGAILAKKFGLLHKIEKKSKFSMKNWVSKPRLNNHKLIMKDRLHAYEKRLNYLIKKVHELGSIPIFVTQSQRRTYDFVDGKLFGDSGNESYNGVDYFYMSKLLNESTKKIANNNNAIFIDLDSEIKFDIENDFYDSSHYTASGAEKIGIYLYNKLNYFF